MIHWVGRYFCYVVVQLAIFYWFKGSIKNDDKVSLLLSLVNSGIFSVIGILTFVEVLLNAFSGNLYNFLFIDIDWWSILSSEYMSSYMVLESVLGYYYYNESMKGPDGYIHHVIYLIMIEYFLHVRHALKLIQLMSLEEIPTYILRRGQMDPDKRNDQLFGQQWLIWRIGFHVAVIILVVFHLKQLETWILFLLLLPILGGHIMWYNNWKKKYGSETTETDTLIGDQAPETENVDNPDVILTEDNQ